MLAQSLELARFSPIAFHLLYLVYEGMVRAAEGSAQAVAVVEEAETFLDRAPACIFCAAGLYIAATIGYARTGDVARARDFLARAEGTEPLWVGGARAATLAEARAAVLATKGSRDEATATLANAAAGFAQAGQVLRTRPGHAPPSPACADRQLPTKKLRGRAGEGLPLMVDASVNRREEAEDGKRNDQRAQGSGEPEYGA